MPKGTWSDGRRLIKIILPVRRGRIAFIVTIFFSTNILCVRTLPAK
jgi:hypothetical protein